MAAKLNNFRCVVDGHVLTDFPVNLYRDRKFQSVDLMTGITSDEGYMSIRYMSLLPPSAPGLSKREKIRHHVKESLKEDFRPDLDAMTDTILQRYFTAEAEENEQTYHRQFDDAIR